MNKTKAAFVHGFAIFAAFFGAGNLILPPYLGFKSGPDWWISAIGFMLTATVIPMVALLVHARLQGTMLDFGNKVSPKFSLVLCTLIYVIAVTLPCPRTAAVTHEMAVAPFLGSSPLLTSAIYFSLVMLFSLNRGRVMDLLGKYLTPVIGLILLLIIGVRFLSGTEVEVQSTYRNSFISGFLEGYQTYDALAGLLMGGILVITIQKSQKGQSYAEKRKAIASAGFIAMAGLFLIYAGLIYAGSRVGASVDSDTDRTALLTLLAESSLGNTASVFLSVLVALACFTTAVGVIVGTADYFKGLFADSDKVYRITVMVCCILGVLIGQWDVSYIIKIAIPVLMFIYPIVITLILLNILPEKLASPVVFRAVVLAAFIFSIPDFIGVVMPGVSLEPVRDVIPFSKDGLGWLLPSLITFIGVNGYKTLRTASA
jgi:LIVCS family branched-chain amino acid:cation transporter